MKKCFEMLLSFIRKIMSIVKLLILCGCTILLVLYFSSVMRPKKTELPNDTTNKIEGFYALEDHSMDVLFFGTSHTYYGFNPAVLYAETGLNSYVFAGECQPFSVTYHYLVEALKTQSPQLVVVDVFALLPSGQKCQTSGIIKKNVEDFKMSQNKIDALSLIENESLLENLLDISIYKDRWNEVTYQDFLFPFEEHFNFTFGFTQGYPVNNPLYVREMYNSEQLRKPEDVNLKYLYQGIDLLLVKTPYYETEEEYEMINYLFQEAQNAGYEAINFNQLYDELDFKFDRDGDVWHCNLKGSWKITHYLSKILQQKLSISVHPGIYHDSYKEMYKKSIGTIVWTSRTAEDYLKMLSQLDVTVLTSYTGKDTSILTDEQWKLLHQIGIETFDFNQNVVSVIQNKNLLYKNYSKEYQMKELELNGQQLVVDSGENWASFRLNGNGYEINLPGINLIVIDNYTNEIIDEVCIDTLNNFQLLRE